MGSASAWSGASVLGAVISLVGCGADVEPVRIIGHCEVVGDAVQLVADEDRTAPPTAPGVGIIEGHVLIEWQELHLLGPSEGYFTRQARWFDEHLDPDGDVQTLGRDTRGIRSQWVEHDGGLWAQMWIDPSESWPPPPEGEQVHFVRVDPPPALDVATTPVLVEVAYDGCPACAGILIGDAALTAGYSALLPSATAYGRVWGALSASPAACGRSGLQRLVILDAQAASASPLLWGDRPCEADDGLRVTNPLLVESDGRLLGLFRTGVHGDGEADGGLRLVGLDERGEPDGPPRRIGPRAGGGAEGGAQPRAVAVGRNRILFLDRSSDGGCQEIRGARTDGTQAGATPWQMPCHYVDPADRTGSSPFSPYVELLALPGGALLIWSERPFGHERVTTDTAWHEEVRAVLLTPEGQRGSGIITVTDPSATALASPPSESSAPLPADLRLGATSFGREAVVAWPDMRVGAPGIYGRRLSCTIDEEGMP